MVRAIAEIAAEYDVLEQALHTGTFQQQSPTGKTEMDQQSQKPELGEKKKWYQRIFEKNQSKGLTEMQQRDSFWQVESWLLLRAKNKTNSTNVFCPHFFRG